jgi:hypothetical protein
MWMTRTQLIVAVVSMVIVVLSGIGLVATGHAQGWVLIAIAAVNIPLTLMAARRGPRPPGD